MIPGRRRFIGGRFIPVVVIAIVVVRVVAVVMVVVTPASVEVDVRNKIVARRLGDARAAVRMGKPHPLRQQEHRDQE